MQTGLQKIGKHFENMLSTSGGYQTPMVNGGLSTQAPIYQSTRMYILSMMRMSLKQSASSNGDGVAISEAYQTPP